MLLRQWGCLLKFDGEKAQIGITERWLKSTKEDRQPMIEKAFQKAKARAITVTFTAVSADTIRAFQEQRTPAEAVSQTLQEGPVIAKTAAPPASSPQSGGAESHVSVIVPTSLEFAETSAKTQLPTLPVESLPESIIPAVTTPVSWQPESDLDRAVKSFAQFFNGQVVDLDSAEPADTSSGEGEEAAPSADREVPF
ncbi:MAG: hypothetical protein HC886_18265 [Leptolyngbyaceae cyanobacterium SM1_1_3]|nr:hypothetical protein [Leptolyngbyaceae cyanobacterium SM1_1_3]